MELIDIPYRLNETFIMSSPNDEVVFYDGEFIVTWKGHNIKCQGNLYFQWLPRLSIKFKWKPDNDTIKLWRPFETDIEVEINAVNLKIVAKGLISKFLYIDEFIVCYLYDQIMYGEKDCEVDFVRFEIANLRSFNGRFVRTENSASHNRLEFVNTESKIVIDQNRNYIHLKDSLSSAGGYQLLYTGILELNNKRKASYKKASEILDSFSYFLILINGRRCFPLFRTGLIDNEIIWGDFTPYFNDEFKYVYSWATDINHNGIESLWIDFSKLWQDKNDRESIKIVLHWYTEANSNTAFSEGSIVLIQNSLELLFHWLISEKLKYVNATDAENLSASAKIGFLLSQFNLKPEIPSEFESLISYTAKNNIINGPEAFTRIRNFIVHPNHKKRKALSEMESKVKQEALQLGIWYVETILLKFLNYSGKYINRCKAIQNISDSEEFQ